jgi:ppGpp synthetase/RelA/SpoT-type nucleotidyltranferase
MFESRVKNPDTIIKKIAAHRKAGKKNYSLRGVNDVYGGRFVVDTPKKKRQIIQALHNLDRMGVLKILKEQQVDKETYHAYHLDIKYKKTRGEIQIHDPQSYLESIVNHEIRAKAGESPPPPLDREKRLNAKVSQKMPDDKAITLAKGLEQMRGHNGSIP